MKTAIPLRHLLRAALRLLPVIAASIAVLPDHASASVVVYRENFNNTTGSNQLASYSGWYARMGDGASAYFTYDQATVGISSSATIGTVPGGALANLGQADTASPTSGFFFAGGIGSLTTRVFGFTDEYTGATTLTKDTLLSIQFYQGNGNSVNATFRAALEIGGNWYVSSSQNGNNVGSATSFASGGVQLTFSSFNLANWFAMDANDLSVSATAISLPSGTVQSFGFYATKADLSPSSSTMRVDYFEVVAIPEPSTAALALAGVGFLVSARRRRRA